MNDPQIAKRIKWLQEEATDREVLSIWRFEPSCSPWLDGTLGSALVNRYKLLVERLSPDEYSTLSKTVGWDSPQ